MSKKIVGVLAAVLFAAVVVCASDVWKDKDYHSWDQKDVDKILKDSPWTKTIQFGGGGSGGMDAPLTATGAAAHGDQNVSGTSSGGGGRPTSAINGTAGSAGAGAETNFIISWYSSRTIREALERRRELGGGTPSDEEKKNATAELATFQVLVRANNLAMFAKDADALKTASYLMPKSTKEKIVPTSVTVEKGQGDRPVAIIYEFPKKTASGEPTIAANEKGVEFFTESGKTQLKVTFEISKMADKQGADF